MTRERPPFVLRLAVVVGAATLLLGLVGVVLIILRGDDPASAAGRGLEAYVRVTGFEADATLAVGVQWENDGMLHREGAHAVEDDPGLFLLPRLPDDQAVTIEVLDTGAETPGRLAARELVVRPGDEVVIDLADPLGH